MTRAVRAAAAVAALLVLAGSTAAQTPVDSLAAPLPLTTAAADSAGAPGRALRRSLLLPGWGQVTNRQPAKAPVIAAGLVGAAAVLVFQQRRYVRYRRSALVAGCLASPDRDACADIPDAATDAYAATGSPTFAQASAIRNTARGRRDIAGLGVVVVYALQALDAYVGAQLLGFDVGEDAVALRVDPGRVAFTVRF